MSDDGHFCGDAMPVSHPGAPRPDVLDGHGSRNRASTAVAPTSTRRRWLQAAGIGSLGTLGLLAAGPALAAPAAPGERVPWPELRLLDGSRWVRADDHAVVIVFWSLTCPFCVRHNARITQLAERVTGRRLQVLTAVRENDPEGVKRHLARHGHRFDVTLDAGPLAAAVSLRRLSPLTVTIDRQGRLLQVIPGEMAEDDVMELQRLAA